MQHERRDHSGLHINTTSEGMWGVQGQQWIDLVWILIQANQCKIYILNNWGHFNILGIRWCQWFTVIFLGVIMACGYIRKWWHFLENEENDEIYFYFFCELITHALCPFFY